jgi:hypothetical protein
LFVTEPVVFPSILIAFAAAEEIVPELRIVAVPPDITIAEWAVPPGRGNPEEIVPELRIVAVLMGTKLMPGDVSPAINPVALFVMETLPPPKPIPDEPEIVPEFTMLTSPPVVPNRSRSYSLLSPELFHSRYW